MPVGTATNLGTRWWAIQDDAGNAVARFDHNLFPHILNGARVSFTDVDGDGIAENVQPATAVNRYMARISKLDDLGEPQKDALFDTIMAELLAARTEVGRDRQARLRRLRASVDRLQP